MNQLLLSKTFIANENYRKKIDDNVAVLTIRPIQFHASSLFKLDLSIVTGIITSITTYLIVVIQFKLSEEQVMGHRSHMTADEISASRYMQIYTP